MDFLGVWFSLFYSRRPKHSAKLNRAVSAVTPPYPSMALYVYVTPECERDARDFGIKEQLDGLREHLEEEQRTPSFSRWFPYLCRSFAKHERLIMKEQRVGPDRVLFFLRVLRAAESAFQRFAEGNQRTEFGNRELEPMIPSPKELSAWINGKGGEERPLKPALSDLERNALDHTFSGASSGFCEWLICETEEWVQRVTRPDLQDSLRDLARTLIEILDSKDSSGVKIWPVKNRHDLAIIARYFPEQQRLILIAPVTGSLDKNVLVGKYPQLFDNDSAKTLTDSDVLRLSARSYPDILAYDEDVWVNEVAKERLANLALSPDETDVLDRARDIFQTKPEGGYPLFINGNAGSGKSTVLQYLFADYLFFWLVHWPKSESRLGLELPVYFASSAELLVIARKTIKSILRSNARRQELDNHKINELLKDYEMRAGQIFQEFHLFLVNLLSEREQRERFTDQRRVNFAKFKRLWQQQFERRPKGEIPSVDICWHVICSHIKGLDRESYTDVPTFRALPKGERTVTEETFGVVHEEVWNRWYKHLTSPEGEYWDDQDLGRRLLEHRKGEVTIIAGRFPAIFCDEAQDFTRIELELIQKLCIYSDRDIKPHELTKVPFVFAGDPFQTLNPTGFRWETTRAIFSERLMQDRCPDPTHARESQHNSAGGINYCVLRYNYRSAGPIVRFCNLIQAARQHLFAIPAKDLEPQEPWRLSDSGTPFPVWFDAGQGDEIAERLRGQTDLTIIVPCLEGGEKDYVEGDKLLKSFVQRDESGWPKNVVSPVHAKGIEYNRVALYGFGKEASADLCNTLRDVSDFTNDRDRALPCEYFLNQLYVAASRPRRRLFIIDEKCHIDGFWKFGTDGEVARGIALPENTPSTKDPDIERETLSERDRAELRWEKWYCTPQPGTSQSWAGDHDDPLDLARAYEEQGRRQKEASFFRQAAQYYGALGHSAKARECRAWAFFFSPKAMYEKAAEEFLLCQRFEEAHRAFWLASTDNALRRMLEIVHQAPALTRTLEHRVADWHFSQREFRESFSMLGEIRNRLEEITFAARIAQEAMLRMAIRNVFSALVEKRTPDAGDAMWKGIRAALLQLQSLGDVASDEDAGFVHFLAGDMKSALERWKRANSTKHAEFKRAQASEAVFPESMQALAELGEHERIRHEYEGARNLPYTAEQWKLISEAYLHGGDLQVAVRTSLRSGNVAHVRTAFDSFKASAPRPAIETLATEIVRHLLTAEQWDECIDFLLTTGLPYGQFQEANLRLQGEMIRSWATSESLPRKPVPVQSPVTEYLKDIYMLGKYPRPTGITEQHVGAALERAGRLVDCLAFYEKIEREQPEQHFASIRWARCKWQLAVRARSAAEAGRLHKQARDKLTVTPASTKDPEKLPTFPELDDDIPMTGARVESDQPSDIRRTEGRVFQWNLGALNFTYNAGRDFLSINSIDDGDFVRIQLSSKDFRGSAQFEPVPEAADAWFRYSPWDVSVDFRELGAKGTIRVRHFASEQAFTISTR